MNDVTLLTTDIINNYRTVTNAPLSLDDYLSLRKQAALELQQGFLLTKEQHKSNEPQKIQETTVIAKEIQRPNKPMINHQTQYNEDDEDDENDEDSNEELLESNVKNNFLNIINKIED